LKSKRFGSFFTNNTNTELSNSNYPDFDGAIWDDAIDSENKMSYEYREVNRPC
jgi:hypothetical protein